VGGRVGNEAGLMIVHEKNRRKMFFTLPLYAGGEIHRERKKS
jgi:hypothetical protein